MKENLIYFQEPIDRILAILAKNTLWLFLTRVGNQAILMVTTVLIARNLGVTGLGRFAFITSLVLLGNALTTFGTDTLLIREVAKNPQRANKLTSDALAIQLIFSAIFILSLSFGSSLIGNQPVGTSMLLKIYSLSLFPMAFFGVFSALLRAHERMDLYLLLNLALGSIQLGGVGLVLVYKGSISGLILVSLLAQGSAACLAYILYRRVDPGFGVRVSFHGGRFIQVIKLAWPLALLTGLTISLQRMGVVVLSFMGEDQLAGWFTAATRPLEGFKFLHYAILGALLPTLSRYSNKIGEPAPTSTNQHASKNVLRTTLTGLLAIGAVTAIFIHFTSRQIIYWLYGDSFGPTAISLSILVWSLIPYSFSSLLSLKLVVEGRERVVLKVYIAIFAITALCYVKLVPMFGLVGASLAWLAGETAQAILLIIVNFRLSAMKNQKPFALELEVSRG